jgi:hypothetical protein
MYCDAFNLCSRNYQRTHHWNNAFELAPVLSSFTVIPTTSTRWQPTSAEPRYFELSKWLNHELYLFRLWSLGLLHSKFVGDCVNLRWFHPPWRQRHYGLPKCWQSYTLCHNTDMKITENWTYRPEFQILENTMFGKRPVSVIRWEGRRLLCWVS